MPEQEGYFGIINLLGKALEALDSQHYAKTEELIMQARLETLRQAKSSVNSMEIGMELERLMNDERDPR